MQFKLVCHYNQLSSKIFVNAIMCEYYYYLLSWKYWMQAIISKKHKNYLLLFNLIVWTINNNIID